MSRAPEAGVFVAMKTLFPDPALAAFLIVDDCDDDAFLLRHRLREADFANPIHSFASTAEAAAWLRAASEPPALMFVDIKMPGASGLDLIAQVRACPAWDAMRIVVATNSNAPADLQRAVDLGVDGYLIKFPPADLLGELIRHGPWFELSRRAGLPHALSA